MPVLSQVPVWFMDDQIFLNRSLFTDHPTRLDFWLLFYTWSVNFLILAFCFYKPKGVYKGVKKYILIVAVLDLIHLVTLGKRGFGGAKIGVAVVLTVLPQLWYYFKYYFLKLWLRILSK